MKKKIIKILNKTYSQPITCLTAYSPSVAKILDGIVDVILVGDSLGTTLYGMSNSQSVTLKMMKVHGAIVKNNVKKSLTVIDMPYKTYNNKLQALKNAKEILKATKAKILKLEINKNNLSIIKYLSDRNIKIIAHIGVTPQSFVDFKNIRAVGKTAKESKELLDLAILSEKAGAIAVLLECVSVQTSKKITNSISVPTIGIGSSKYCDGQVLVFDDLINMDNKKHLPKFVKTYINFEKISKVAVKKFCNEVKKGKFPSKRYTYN